MIGGGVDTKRQNEGQRKSKTTDTEQIKGQEKKTRDKKN
jgi:hypothetical protein